MKICTYICIFLVNGSIALVGQGLFESALTISDSSFSSSNTNLHGFVRSAVYGGKNSNEKLYLQSLYGTFALNADIPAGNYGSAYAEVRFRTGNEFSADFDEISIREAFVNLYLGSLQIRAGKQIFTEGVTSIPNPTDIYAPTNPAFRSPYPDDLRLGIWALSARFRIKGNSSMVFTWLPVYRPTKVIIDAFEFPFDVIMKDYAVDKLLLKTSGVLGKYTFRSTCIDMDLSFYHGYRNTPGIAADTVIMHMDGNTLKAVKLIHAPYLVNAPGVNMSVPIGEFIFRGEGAWISIYDKPDDFFSEISYAAEMEKSGSAGSVIMGYYGKHILDFKPPVGDPYLLTGNFPDMNDMIGTDNHQSIQRIDDFFQYQVDYFNRIYTYQAKKYYHSVYVSLHLKIFHELLKLSLPAMFNFNSQELMIIPSADLFINDQLNVNVGGYFLKGNNSSLYHLAGPALNAAYVMFQLKF